MSSRLTLSEVLDLLDNDGFRLSDSESKEESGDDFYSYGGKPFSNVEELATLRQAVLPERYSNSEHQNGEECCMNSSDEEDMEASSSGITLSFRRGK